MHTHSLRGWEDSAKRRPGYVEQVGNTGLAKVVREDGGGALAIRRTDHPDAHAFVTRLGTQR